MAPPTIPRIARGVSTIRSAPAAGIDRHRTVRIAKVTQFLTDLYRNRCERRRTPSDRWSEPIAYPRDAGIVHEVDPSEIHQSTYGRITVPKHTSGRPTVSRYPTTPEYTPRLAYRRWRLLPLTPRLGLEPFVELPDVPVGPPHEPSQCRRTFAPADAESGSAGGSERSARPPIRPPRLPVQGWKSGFSAHHRT